MLRTMTRYDIARPLENPIDHHSILCIDSLLRTYFGVYGNDTNANRQREGGMMCYCHRKQRVIYISEPHNEYCFEPSVLCCWCGSR